MQRQSKGKNRRSNSVALGEVLWFPSKEAQDNSFELSCPTRWEKLASQSAQTSWNHKLIMLTPKSFQQHRRSFIVASEIVDDLDVASQF